MQDTERILYPLKRVGKRGEGRFERATWDEALADIGGRIRKAIQEDRRQEVMYHVGRPGEDHFMQRLMAAWGIDGLNTHTNVCSASARTGFALWCGADRPSPDYSEAKFALLLSAHLETGHYFNPHAQRIMGAKERGMRLAVVDTRLSNSASHADLWVSTWPGSEAYLLLAVARELLRRDAAGVTGPNGTPAVDRVFVQRWVNWREYLAARDAGGPGTFERFMERLAAEYEEYTHEGAADECKVPAETVARLADEIVAAEGKFTSHLWRNAASGNLGGWQIARALLLLHVLTGSFGTRRLEPERVGQVRAQALREPGAPRSLERAPVPARVAARALRALDAPAAPLA
ncbi:MAG: molybdopterin-dependent oxidoreductase [Planctomycetota bacterium]